MGRYRESGVDLSKNIVRLHPEAREEIERIQNVQYNGRIAFTQASRELVEQKRNLEQKNRELQKRVEELLSNSRRTKLL